MKKTVILFVGIYLALVANIAFGQLKVPDPLLQNIGNIESIIGSSFKPDHHCTDTLCANFIILTKFKVVGDQIKILDISKNNPVEIKDAIRKAFIAANGAWKSTVDETAKIKDKVFVLPMIFYYQSGCSPTILSNAITADPKMLRYKNPDSSLHTSLKDMFKFETGNDKLLDCILLQPLIFSSYD